MTPAGRLLAVLDIGKTNTRLSLADPGSAETLWSASRPSTPLPGPPWAELALSEIETWLIDALGAAPERRQIGAIVPVAHGAAAVLIDAAGEVLAAPDYEDPAFETWRDDYAGKRGPFSETFSPLLPLGLNLGAQLHHIGLERPDLIERTAAILPYPQYWAWRLCGVAASEATSLGVHTDLWRPAEGGYSNLAHAMGWSRLFAPLRRAAEPLAQIRPELAAATGLDPSCKVICGLHDSNASYYAHLASQPSGAPFAAVSSGTWTIVMARGAPLARLAPEEDMLANVDADGQPAPTARFMGGRDYEALAGSAARPTKAGLETVLELGLMALAEPSGPAAPVIDGALAEIGGLAPQARAALASLYCALRTDRLLDRLGARGPVIIDGPLAANPLFAPLLAALRPDQAVQRARIAAGAVAGACALLGWRGAPGEAVQPMMIEGLDAHRQAWRARQA